MHRQYSQFLERWQRRSVTVWSVVLIVFSFDALAGDNNGRGVKSVGMANLSNPVTADAWQMFYNPSLLSRIHGFAASVFFVPQQFGLQELRTNAFAVALPTSLGTIAASMERFGFDLYEETGVAISLGKEIEAGFSAGTTLHYVSTDIHRYGSFSAASCDIGIAYELSKSLMGSASVRRLISTTSYGHENPPILTFGFAFSFFEQSIVGLEIEKEGGFPADLRAGLEYRILEQLSVRVGTANNPSKFSAGFSLHHNRLQFGFAAYSHLELGWTHQVELTWTGE
jgi:hypothetical protein